MKGSQCLIWAQNVFMGLITLAFVALSPNVRADTKTICILSFEREAHPFTSVIHDVFKNAPNTYVRNESIPLDILNCIHQGSSEIIMVVHSAILNLNFSPYHYGRNEKSAERKMNSKSFNVSPPVSVEPSSLCYFKRLTGEDRIQAIKFENEMVQKNIDKIIKTADKVKDVAYSDPRGSSRLLFGPNEIELIESKRYLKKIKSISDDQVIYASPKIVLPAIFERLVKELQSEKDQTGQIRLKRIRISCCNPQGVRLHYKNSMDALESLGVFIEFAPPNRIVSKLLNVKDAVSLSAKWLSESLK